MSAQIFVTILTYISRTARMAVVVGQLAGWTGAYGVVVGCVAFPRSLQLSSRRPLLWSTSRWLVGRSVPRQGSSFFKDT